MMRIGGLLRLGLLAISLAPQIGCSSSGSFLSNPWASLSSEAAVNGELPPDQAVKACLAVAQNLESSGNEAGALAQYERVARLAPENYEASRRLAVLYDRQSDFVRADEQYAKLTKLRPKDALLWNDWGYSYYERNKWKESEEKLRKALEIEPKNRRAHQNLGLAMGQQGRYPEALEQFKIVVSEADAHTNLAFVYWSQGKLDDARRECHTAQQLDSTCKGAPGILAQLDRAELPPEAKQAMQMAAAKQKGNDRGRNRGSAATTDSRTASPLSSSGVAPSTYSPSVPAAGTPRGSLSEVSGESPIASPTPSPLSELKPIYTSPTGTSWIPTKPAPPSSPSPSAGSSENTSRE